MARKIVDAIHGAYPVAPTFAAAAARTGPSRRASAYGDYERRVRASHEVEETNGRFRSAPRYRQPVRMTAGSNPVETWASRLPPSYAAMLRQIAKSRQPLPKVGNKAAPTLFI